MENEEIIKEYLRKPIVTEYGTHNVFCPNCFFREGHPIIWCPTCGTKLIKYTEFKRIVTWVDYILAGLTYGVRLERAASFLYYSKVTGIPEPPPKYEQRKDSQGILHTFYDSGRTKEWADYFFEIVTLAQSIE
jgi:hypothetical protein